jgi:hypothetical protein
MGLLKNRIEELGEEKPSIVGNEKKED